ncbi:MAG: patatin-like phospholipase family protein [Bacteroidales bacterium]
MEVSKFFESSEIKEIEKRAEKLRNDNKVFSDVTDKKGFQYVDLVQEGGGVLGIALIGYTWVLEKAGIRFFNQAGASAGAINTLLMSAIKGVDDEKSMDILTVLANQTLFDFVDGGSKVKNIIQRVLDKKSVFFPLLFSLGHLKNKLVNRMGLNPGFEFEKWMRTILENNKIQSLNQLMKKRSELPEMLYNNNGNIETIKYDFAKIAIIATDSTTKTKVDFPRMATLYWDLDKKDVHPASFVRASMSIPFFFEPFTVKDIPSHGSKENKNWQDMAGYNGVIPKEIKFVDGGLLSNFPINIFHLNSIPRKPTFGVRLSAFREQPADTSKLPGFLGGMLEALRQQNDYDFLLKHPDYKKLICNIDADQKYNWLDFNISDENKIGLFTLGAKKAIHFIENFNWIEYKEIRKKALVDAS